MKKVFVVVLNWNRADLTVDCLKSLQKLRTSNFELCTVVVDNGSSDDSVSKIRNSKLQIRDNGFKFKIIQNKKNIGYAGGNNVGIKYALENGADYACVLNNDTLVDKDLVLNLFRQAESEDKFGASSPKIYFAPGFEFHKERYGERDLGKVLWYAGGKIDWRNVYGLTNGVDEVDARKYDETKETDFATGTCMFLSAKALKDAGLFNKNYFMYYEDTELSQRMKRKGYKIFYNAKGCLWHKVAQSSGIGSELNDYFTTRNRMLFGMTYASMRTKFALIRESVKLLLTGRKWQKIGIKDYYLGNSGKGSWGKN